MNAPSKRKPGSANATKSSAAAARSSSGKSSPQRPSGRGRKPVPDPAYPVRPALIYALVLASTLALGAGAIKVIHESTPELAGFSRAASGKTQQSIVVPVQPVSLASLDLMRSQRWIAPAALELIDPTQKKSRQAKSELPPEIAAVSEVLMDVKPLPEPSQYRPVQRPPDASTLFANTNSGINGARSELSLPPIRGRGQYGDAPIAPSDAAIIVNGGQTMPERVDPGAITDQIGSVIRSLGNNAEVAAQPPGNDVAVLERPGVISEQVPASLAQAQSACSGMGFVSRIACQDKIRDEYCQGRWNRTSECRRDNRTSNF